MTLGSSEKQMAEGLQRSSETHRQSIRAAVRDVVLIDAHGHNLVELDSPLSFLHAFSEAGPDVLQDVRHTISFKRGVEDIAALYGIDASLEAIEAHRRGLGLQVASSKCFAAANIGTLLIDDGLTLERAKELTWHSKVVPRVHRILRIEALAEEIVNEDNKYWSFKALVEKFNTTLNSLLPSIVAFKSIAAYRSGLDIDPTVTDVDAERGLLSDTEQAPGSKAKAIRLQNKAVIDRLFVTALEFATSHGLPMQIHTGFGDKDLDLRLANPLLLRRVLEDKRFSNSRLVLLHASYPYMREATYLSSVYQQVFLDFGLAIPKLTIRGMKAVMAELMELTPLNKLMFSTDGCAFPETYFLGAKWAREVLAQVLCEFYDNGDMLVDQAIAAATDILRNNSVDFYNLQETKFRATQATLGEGPAQKGELDKVQIGAEENDSTGVGPKPSEMNESNAPTETPWINKAAYVRLMWGDGSGQRRCRVVPSARYKASVAEHGVGLTKVCMGMSSHSDGPAPGSGLSCVGEVRLIPDAGTGHYVPQWGDGLVLADMYEAPGKPWEYCPRSNLRRLVNALHDEFGLSLRAGFENEFYLLRKAWKSSAYEGVDCTNYCSTSGLNQSLPVMNSIMSWLEELEVDVEQFHPEAGGGQFEIVLAHDTALRSADKLLLAREAITAAALGHQLIATFLPKLDLHNTAFGSGSHVHLSLWKQGKNVLSADDESTSKYGMSATGENFFAGLLQHLPAVMAIVSPHPNSYDRIKPNTWSGAFQCWGRENREAPLRAVGDTKRIGVVNNFELKSFDGCANPHLGLAAIVAAGLSGLRNKLQLPSPVEVNPADLERGQVAKLPTDLRQATESLEGDKILQELLGKNLVTAILAVRRAEIAHYSSRSRNDVMNKLVQIY